MAWYSGTFYCGHEGYINIIGPLKNREKMSRVQVFRPLPGMLQGSAAAKPERAERRRQEGRRPHGAAAA